METNNPIKLVARAQDFAIRQHLALEDKKHQLPWLFLHIAGIGRLLAEATDGKDHVVVTAGILHNILEQTDCTAAQLEERFGSDVARVVEEVSVARGLSVAEQMGIRALQAPECSRRAKMVQMADLINYVTSMDATPDGKHGPLDLIRYLTWTAEIVTASRSAHPALGAMFDRSYRAALERIRADSSRNSGSEGEELRHQLGEAFTLIAAAAA
jgi:hypothetical protein